MNELIIQSTINGAEVNSVNARDLHKELGLKSDFSTWIKKELKMFVEDTDYVLLHKKMEQVSGAKLLKEYIITIETAKHLAMIQRSEKGMEIRNYFIELEKEYIRNLENKTVPELTPFQLMEKAYHLEAKRHEHTHKLLEVEKSITKTLEIELDSVTDTDGLLDMKSFSMLVTSRTHGVNFGRTKVYMALRSCKLVGDDTRPTQSGLTSYLEVRMVEGNNGVKYPKTFVIGHKFEKLLSLIIRKIKDDDILNEQLGFPFGE